MTPDPVTCGPDDTVETAATLMHDNDISRLPVVDDGRLVGIVARGDILRAIISDPAGGVARGPRASRPGPRSTSAPSAHNVARPGRPVGARPRSARWSRPTATATAPSRWPGPRSTPAPLAGRGPGRGGGRAAGRRASTRRSCCCPSPGPTSSPRWSALDLRPPSTPAGVAAAAAAAGRPPLPVHLKVDTGMHRVGAPRTTPWPWPRPSSERPELDLGGGLDPLRGGRRARPTPSPPSSSTASTPCWPTWPAAGIEVPLTHAANSAGAIAHPGARARPGPVRHRRLRRRPVAGPGRRPRPAAGAAPAAPRSPW